MGFLFILEGLNMNNRGCKPLADRMLKSEPRSGFNIVNFIWNNMTKPISILLILILLFGCSKPKFIVADLASLQEDTETSLVETETLEAELRKR